MSNESKAQESATTTWSSGQDEIKDIENGDDE